MAIHEDHDENKPDPEDKGTGWQESLGEEGGNPPTPRSSGDQLYALDQWWTVSPCEVRIKAQFEQWVKRNAKMSIAEAEMERDVREAERLREAYQGSLGAGHYTWDGKYTTSARADYPGLCFLLFLLLRRCDPNITEEIATKIFNDKPTDSMHAIGWAVGNAQGPAEESGKTKTEGNGSTAHTAKKIETGKKMSGGMKKPVTLDSP